MEINGYTSKVSLWLDTLPSELIASTSEEDDHRPLKRRRYLDSSGPRKPQHPFSTPPSEAENKQLPLPVAISSDDFHHMVPSTPNRQTLKRPVGDISNIDIDQTPRADTVTKSISSISNPPNLSSQSDAAYSRDSKRSRRSQSPTKLFPLYGPKGHRLVRGSLRSNPVTPALAPSLQLLVSDIKRLVTCYSIMPRRIKAALEERLQADGNTDPLFDHMYFNDDEDASERDQTGQNCASDGELVRRACRIADRTNECSRMLSDESAWNNLVHSPLLEMFVYDMQDGQGQDVLDFMPCTTTNIDSEYHRFHGGSSRIDYVFRLFPYHDPTAFGSADQVPCLNWTADHSLQLSPLAFSIETKRHGGDVVKGEQQLGIWHAAQWEFLISRAGAEAVDCLDFLPGIMVQGHIWSLLFTTRREAKTTVLGSIQLGDTSTVIGVFQVIACLQRLRKWSLDTLWPWYKHHLPELSNIDDL